MRIDEVSNSTEQGIAVSELIRMLKSMHDLVQMGGSKRVFSIGETGKVGVIYVIEKNLDGGGCPAIGIGWKRGSKKVCSLYAWATMNTSEEPDVAVDMPVEITLEEAIDLFEKLIKQPKVGLVEADEKPRVRFRPGKDGEDDKITMITPQGSDEKNDTAPETEAPEDKKSHIRAAKGQHTIKVANAPSGSQSDIDDLTHRLLQKNKVALIARKGTGEYFFVPGMEAHLKKLDKMLADKIAEDSDGKTMEEQYDALETEVKMIARGTSKFVKALIVIGAPSAGKSFRVTKTLKEEGLHEGRDFTFKTGSVTKMGLYLLLLTNINGMIVFDDCDSIWEDANSANYLKGALNTGDVRTINMESARTQSVSTLSPEERRKWLNAASRVMRNRPLAGDIQIVCPKLHGIEDHSASAFKQYLAEAQRYLRQNPPDQIDFRGRVIFISNLEKEDFNQAVLSRSNFIELKFGDDEMLDFMERIGDKIEGTTGDALSQEEIEEVFTFVRFHFQGEGFKSPVNFRFIQKCFDYRRTSSNWKNMIAKM